MVGIAVIVGGTGVCVGKTAVEVGSGDDAASVVCEKGEVNALFGSGVIHFITAKISTPIAKSKEVIERTLSAIKFILPAFPLDFNSHS